jgi:ribose transport system permease protein
LQSLTTRPLTLLAAVCCAIIYVFAIIVQDHTRLGRYVFAIGGNAEGARLSGINTRFWKWVVYTFAGFLTGLAAVILVARLEVADPLVGMKWEFEAIAATILGGTSLNIGKGDVKGTIVGVALLTVIRSGLNVIRIPSLWQPAIIGAVIIIAIVFQVSITSKEMKK